MNETKLHVRDIGNGDLRVGETRVPLESVIASWKQGDSPESIRGQYRSLSLPDVYGAISWMLDHPEETAAYIRRQEALWEEFRKNNDRIPAELRERIRSARQVQSQ